MKHARAAGGLVLSLAAVWVGGMLVIGPDPSETAALLVPDSSAAMPQIPDEAAPAPAEVLEGEPVALDPAAIAALSEPAARPPGQQLPSAPEVPPGRPAPSTPPELETVRAHLLAGDTRRALRAAEAFTEAHKWGRRRDAAWTLIGLIHREEGRHNLASEAFTRVRTAGGPLAPFGAYYEAEQDLLRGKPEVAVRECEAYRQAWPEGTHAGACLRVIARGHASLGHVSAARDAAALYDEQHPKAPISEQIELAIAMWETDNAPERAVPRLRALAISHRAALTGRVAEESLDRLAAQGVPGASLPDDVASLQSRAVSLRESARLDDAWAQYQQLAAMSQDDPRLRRWVEDSAEVFGWRTRNWDALAELYAARYKAAPNGEDAWDAHRVLGRGGRWKEAAEWARLGQKKHGTTRRWRGMDEEIGRTFLLAGAYPEARDAFDAVAKQGGWTGRRGEFYAGFAAHLAGEHQDAIGRFTKIVDNRRGHEIEARYWRSKAYDALGQPHLAAVDRAWISQNDGLSWYGLLVAQGVETDEAVVARDGTWPGPRAIEPPPQLDVIDRVGRAVPMAAWVSPRLLHAAPGFAQLTWAAPVETTEPDGEIATLPALARRDLLAPPSSYRPGSLYDPTAAGRAFSQLAESQKATWPVLQAVEDLVSAGLYDIAGPLFSDFYEDWRAALKSARHPRNAAARQASRPVEQWRSLFLFARDHHHTARFVYGLERNLEDPALKVEALRLGWPLAHDRYVWKHSTEHDIDPYMVLGLMRQESTYNAIAVSPVGARGAMQIMPRTGHLLADVFHDTRFTAGDLEDPIFSVGYGISYLGLLMDRFDGAYPLAVAAYNGGPHNVSSWLGGTGLDVPMDVFVEMIPFRETRNYVKHVSSNYATYLALYAPDGGRVTIPPTPIADDRSVVNF